MPTVRGENVVVLRTDTEDTKNRGILGAIVPGATVLVSYPDGEMGYVKPEQIQED